MNREMRRQMKRVEKQQNKYEQKLVQKGLDMYHSPCAYVNNKPLYSGSCVFLKPDNEIQGQYDWQLNRLIDKNHRFVILDHLGPKKGVVMIGLLSTCSYLNEENELGIKLNGTYHKNKYVYMDAINRWVIDTTCIASIDYNLTYEDRVRCLTTSVHNSTKNAMIHKGLIDNKIVDKYFNYFEHIFSGKYDEKTQTNIDYANIKRYVLKLSSSNVIELLEDISYINKNILVSVLKTINENYPNDYFIDDDQYYREVLTLCLMYTDKENITKVSKHMQVGY